MIAPQQGVLIAGRYTLVRQLARGGMGSVWLARHQDLEIEVTVKFMSSALVAETEHRVRFEREAKVAARLRSQHVVQVLDYGVQDDAPYIVMELLKGESLSTRLSREGKLSIPVTARLVVQICKALRTAHEAGLVHRDLKPGNIFLALKDGDEVVKVLDFGIAKAEGMVTANTASGVMLGSVHYMSPEQIRSSRTVDHRADLWAVGVIVYRLLTGRLPFPGADIGDVLVRVCVDPIPPATSVAADLPARVDEFFSRALARDPDQRFQSAQELAEAFSAMALAPAPAPAPVAPKWSYTVPLGNAVQEAMALVQPRDEATKMLAAAQTPPPAAPFTPPPAPSPQHPMAMTTPMYAPQPGFDAGTGSIRAVQVSSARIEPPSLVVHAPAGPARGRSSWPLWAAAALMLIAGIASLAFVSRASPPAVPAPPSATASSAPPSPAPGVASQAPVASSEPAAPPPSPPPAVSTAAAPPALPIKVAEPKPSPPPRPASPPSPRPAAPARTSSPLDRPF